MASLTDICGYQIDYEKILGSGGFGTVYKGYRCGKVTAAKRVSKTHRRGASMEAVRYHYMKEKVMHENIVKVFDVKTWRESMWIFMEFCEMGDLDNYFIQMQDAILVEGTPIHFAFPIVVDILKGLDFLHDKGIVHRDIKPGNILMKNQRAKLGDFGLSKILDPSGETSSMSSDVGTMIFKAPEFWDTKVREKVRYHRNVDVYSAGLTFAAMLQFVPGHRLRPSAQCHLYEYEMTMPIGQVAFFRGTDVNIFADRIERNSEPLLVKEIQAMLRTSPLDRVSAKTALERLLQHEGFFNSVDDELGPENTQYTAGSIDTTLYSSSDELEENTSDSETHVPLPNNLSLDWRIPRPSLRARGAVNIEDLQLETMSALQAMPFLPRLTVGELRHTLPAEHGRKLTPASCEISPTRSYLHPVFPASDDVALMMRLAQSKSSENKLVEPLRSNYLCSEVVIKPIHPIFGALPSHTAGSESSAPFGAALPLPRFATRSSKKTQKRIPGWIKNLKKKFTVSTRA